MRLVIIGAGFAGMYAALSAARLREIQGVSPDEFEIALVAPEPTLVVRPRLYEPKPETLTAPLKSPVAVRTLPTSTSRPRGNARARPITSTVKIVATGERARCPAELKSACAWRAR